MSSLVVKLPDVRYVWNPKTSRNRMINSLHERKRRRYLNIILLPKLWVEPEQKLWHPFYEIQWWYVIMKLIPKLVAFYCTVLNNKHWPGHYEKVFKLCEIKVFPFANERCIKINAIHKISHFLLLPASPMMDQTLKKQMTHTIMLAGDFRTASRKFPWNIQIFLKPDIKLVL